MNEPNQYGEAILEGVQMVYRLPALLASLQDQTIYVSFEGASQEQLKRVIDIFQESKPSPPHFSKTVDKHFWDLK